MFRALTFEPDEGKYSSAIVALGLVWMCHNFTYCPINHIEFFYMSWLLSISRHTEIKTSEEIKLHRE